MPAQTIVFIHGLFVTRHCWDGWIRRYEERGHTCLAVAWPGRDQTPAALRERPDPQLADLTLAAVIAHHEQIIRSLPEPPLIVGHSMGGLIAQILLQRGLASAAVAIDSAPPRGILSLKWSFLKSNWPTLNLLRSARRPYLMPFKHFQYAFVNGMPLAEQQAAYAATVVPESLRAARGALSSLAQIDFKRTRGPLLLVAGGADQIIPAALNQANYRAYAAAPARTEFKQFAGRNHFLIGQPGWEEIADFSLDWLTNSR